MGIKNHSKEFARNFLSHVHNILKSGSYKFYKIENDLTIGFLADKTTVNHRTRHIIGIRISIFLHAEKFIISNTIFKASIGRQFNGWGTSTWF